jgi:hypothetical protein
MRETTRAGPSGADGADGVPGPGLLIETSVKNEPGGLGANRFRFVIMEVASL